MINKFIRNFVAKQIAGRSDDGIMITLRDPQKVELAENIMAELLMRNGIDPRAITSEAQLKTIINQIEAASKQTTESGIRNVESAKVFNIEGQQLDPNKPIIGGTQTDKKLSKELSDRLSGKNTELIKQRIADREKVRNEMKNKYGFTDERLDEIENTLVDEEMADRLIAETDQPPPGSRGGDDDIAAPVQSSEESLRDMMIAENKKNINKIKQRQKMLNEAIDNVSPSFSGDRKVDAELVAEDLATKMGLTYDDMPTKERLKLYDEAYQGLTKKKFDPPENLATGGRVGLKFGSGLRFLQRVFGKQGLEEMKTRDPEMYVGLLEVVDMYRKRDKEGLKMYLQKFLPHMDDTEIEDFIRGSDGSEGLVGELIRLGSGRDYKGKLEMIKKSEEMKKLRDLEVTEDMLRKPNADGGIMRLGLKEGSGMTRRTFLKILGGAASIPIIGKIFKPFKIGKTVTKVPIIKTDSVPGKPEWFDQLVNKVILEGDDVTKRFATAERQSIHQKTLNNGAVVRVTEDIDDGAVRVEYDSLDNVFEDTVQMQYKKPLPDEGDPRPIAEFDVAESGPVGRQSGPDDYDIEIDEVSGKSIRDLDSDVSILKEYATGEKPTMKELVQNIKRKDKAKRITTDTEAQSDAIIKRQGEMLDYDPEPDFASGGIARMLGE